MRHTLLLALRYMAYHRLRSAILVVCVSIAIFLPTAVHVLVDYYNRMMIERAEATPLVAIYARYSAGGEPIVGTSLEYFEFRGLEVAKGTLPQLAGEVASVYDSYRKAGDADPSALPFVSRPTKRPKGAENEMHQNQCDGSAANFSLAAAGLPPSSCKFGFGPEAEYRHHAC